MIAAVTGLEWGLFRDEPMYLKGTFQTQDQLPALMFWLNFNPAGTLLWAATLEWIKESVAALRLSVVAIALVAFVTFYRLCTRVTDAAPGRALLLVACVPEVCLYTYQVNGTVPTLLCAFAACLLCATRTKHQANTRLSCGQFRTKEKQ